MDMTDTRVVLPFHKLMLPHWENFASALDKRHNLEVIAFGGFQLPLSVLETVLPSMQPEICLKRHEPVGTWLGPSGFMYLSSFLQ